MMRAEHRKALELSEDFLRAFQQSEDPGQLITVHFCMAESAYWMGSFQTARRHCEMAVPLLNISQPRFFMSGTYREVQVLLVRANILWMLGYPDLCLRQGLEVVALARQLDHPFTLAVALGRGLCKSHRLRREPEKGLKYAEEMMRCAAEGKFPAAYGWAMLEMGWSRAMQGEAKEGIAQMQEGLATWRSAGTENGTPLFLLMLAEGYAMARKPEKGLSLMEEALSFAQRTEERNFDAGLYRAKGQLLQMSGKLSKAEACFRHAIEVARGQEAKSWELQAAVRLSRLLQEQGRSAEARPLLSGIYDWFTEGFDTPDLREAKALLDELGE